MGVVVVVVVGSGVVVVVVVVVVVSGLGRLNLKPEGRTRFLKRLLSLEPEPEGALVTGASVSTSSTVIWGAEVGLVLGRNLLRAELKIPLLPEGCDSEGDSTSLIYKKDILFKLGQ